ncbi:MAG: cob(I)yrinic acid a,c-diamide adenosyltransferase [Anaerolineae bacterium]|nr:cob(I)yrinic acid a,c-diamide adenosyltransferase [Anaerolineae bacterium]
MASNFYTRRGDKGTTGLLGEGRISKSDLRIDALGTVDEVTAALGMARATCQSQEAKETLVVIQRDLYNLMAEVAATPENAAKFRGINEQRVAWLEERTDWLAGQVELPREFIVPGDSQAGAAIDLARAITRRSERRLVELTEDGGLNNEEVLRYMNRLSSFCFVLELFENQIAGTSKPTLAKG